MKVYTASLISALSLGMTASVWGKGIRVDSSMNSSKSSKGRGQRFIDPTTGDCAIDIRLQEDGEELDYVPSWHETDNILVTLAGDSCDVAVSDTWTIGNWEHTIVQIAPNAVFKAPALSKNERHAIKLARGTLLDVNYDGVYKDGHWETYVVGTPNRAVPFWVDSFKDEFKAGPDGAVMVYMRVTEEDLMESITSMEDGPVMAMDGPFMEGRAWVRCSDLFGEAFDGIEFWNFAGMKMQENDGTHLMYMQHWTLREDSGADGYHDNHPNSFGEIHMALYTGNAISGMQTTLLDTTNKNFTPNPPGNTTSTYSENDQPEVQISLPWAPGVGHGPLWSINPETGEPVIGCDGKVYYPYHRHLISANGPMNSPLRYTMWTAFEHPVEHIKVPVGMLTSFPNAYLQTIALPDCGDNGDDAKEPETVMAAE